MEPAVLVARSVKYGHLSEFGVRDKPRTDDLPGMIGTVDEAIQHKDVLAMHARGMSYRQFAQVVGIHFTRVGQIVKSEECRVNQHETIMPVLYPSKTQSTLSKYLRSAAAINRHLMSGTDRINVKK